MTTLAVAAILAGLAVPGMQRFLEWQRATGAMHALTTQLALARNAAQVHAQVREKLPSISLGTVYRTLDALVRDGMVTPI